jgi:Cyclic nucleotide-binding domain
MRTRVTISHFISCLFLYRTVTAKETTALFRVDQKSFRYILQSKAKEGEGRKNKLLKDVKFLKGLNDMDLAKLAANMTPRTFHKGEVLGKKGDEVAFFWLVETGQLQASDIEVGGKKYEDFVIGPGGYFGQYAIVSEQPRLGNLVALEDGMAFRIDKNTFKEVIGDLDQVLIRSVDKIALVSTLSDNSNYITSTCSSSYTVSCLYVLV